ncbi:ankyrin-1-like isoform X2 [Ptychodera flava]|uniref:ankyrin-1-like isoform X2 n=2 Tax=Ptychodera flava TaxID=63121 RepID=UPI00396A0B9C
MSTDEGIDTDMEHEFKDDKPDDGLVDQSDSGFPGNNNVFGETFLYSTPKHVPVRKLSETNSDIISRHLEELSGMDYGISASTGDLHHASSFKEAGDIALSHTDMMTLMFEDDFEIQRDTGQTETLSDSSSDEFSNHIDSGDGLSTDFVLPSESTRKKNEIGGSAEEDEDWSKFLHIVSEDIASLKNMATENTAPSDTSMKDEPPLLHSVERQLFSAIASGDVHEARKLTHKVNLSHRIDGFTVLHQAAIHNMSALIPPLFYFIDFARMMDIPVSNPSSRFHGHTAMQIAKALQNQQVVDAIDEYMEVEQSLSDLHKAARAGLPYMVTNLCKDGAAVNGRAKMQITPLYCAVTVGRLDIVEILASFGGNLKTRNQQSDTLLHRASQLGHKDIAEFLISKRYDRVDVDELNYHEETALHKATYHEYVDMVEFLLQNGAFADCADDCGYTPLHIASCMGNMKMAKLLLNHGANVGSRDTDQWTPLHYAAKYGHLQLVELLMQSGAPVRAETKGLQNTALHVAVENGNHKVAEALLDGGANPATRNACGHSALHVAAVMNDLQMAELLTEKGADADSLGETKKKTKTRPRKLYPTMGGKALVQVESVQKIDGDETHSSPTPLHFAAKHDSMSVMLHLIDRAADVDARDDLGKTPLHYAAESGHIKVVETLLDHGATVDAVDNRSRTPLHYASVNGHVDVVDLLLSVGASVQAVTERKNTPLHCAANKGHVTVVEKLVQSGAETAKTDAYNWTPLHWAAAKEQQRTLELLIKRARMSMAEHVRQRLYILQPLTDTCK